MDDTYSHQPDRLKGKDYNKDWPPSPSLYSNHLHHRRDSQYSQHSVRSNSNAIPLGERGHRHRSSSNTLSFSPRITMEVDDDKSLSRRNGPTDDRIRDTHTTVHPDRSRGRSPSHRSPARKRSLRSKVPLRHDYQSNRGRPSSRSRSPFRRNSSDNNRVRERGKSSGNQPSYRKCRVYVGNLAENVDWVDLKELMRLEIGPVAHANVNLDSAGRSVGHGIVEFLIEDNATAAIQKMNNMNLKGRPLIVREDRESKLWIGCSGRDKRLLYSPPIRSSNRFRQVFVANLPISYNWQELKNLFRKAGTVEKAATFNSGNRSLRMFGKVLFKEADEAARAVEMFNGYELRGREIEVCEDKKYAEGFVRDEYRPRSNSGLRQHGGNQERVSVQFFNREIQARPTIPIPNTTTMTAAEYIPSRPTVGSGEQILIHNLPLTTTDQDVIDLFRFCGTVLSANILMQVGRPRGIGRVRFATAKAGELAIGE
ncbi:hypothetical protein BGZ83_003866 [Gryganskiella cystojenkinii]|nr:hypothetical protein BGZ83_003866 [Gryganskiella cystojenkinii]